MERQAPRLGLPHPEGHEGAVGESDAGAERDQRVHVDGAVAQAAGCREVDVPARPPLGDRGDHEHDRHDRLHGVDGKRDVHQGHEAEPHRQGRDPPPLELDELGLAAYVSIVLAELRLLRIVDSRRSQDGLIARLLDGGADLGEVGASGIEVHQRGLGGEVDVGVLDALDAADGLGDAAHAARAGHALDLELLLRGCGGGGAHRDQASE